MPTTKEIVSSMRDNTVCEYCGGRPIEWHNANHNKNKNRRISRLVALDYPLDVILTEINECTALCRACHMVEDGRLDKLRKLAARNKYYRKEPVNCTSCGIITKPSWKGMCHSCYEFERRHGVSKIEMNRIKKDSENNLMQMHKDLIDNLKKEGKIK